MPTLESEHRTRARHTVQFATLSLMIGAFFLWSCWARRGQAIGQDELHWLEAGNGLFEEGRARDFETPSKIAVYSPHLYAQTIRASYTVFGQSLSSARLPGILSWLLTAIGVFWVVAHTERIPRHQARFSGLAAAACCLLLPVAPQAALIIDIDNTILVPSVFLLCVGVWRFLRAPDRIAWAIVVLGMTMALWGRVTTPLILVPVFLGIGLGARTSAARLGLLASALAVGTALFLITWALYCRVFDVSFPGPFLYTFGAFIHRTSTEGGFNPSWLAQSTVYLCLWLGVMAPVGILWLTAWRGRDWLRTRRLEPGDVFLVSGLCLLVGYTVVGGTVFGFPKHHCPGVPLLCVAAGFWLRKTRFDSARTWILCIVMILAALIQFLVAGDLLYTVRYTLRGAMLNGTPTPKSVAFGIALRLGIAAALWAVTVLATGLGGHRSMLGLTLGATVLGAGIGLQAMQNFAPYHTGYLYGDTETRAVAQNLQNVPPGKRIVAPGELIHLLERSDSPHVPNPRWHDQAWLLATISDPKTGALATSYVTNALADVRLVRDNPAIQKILQTKYTYTRMDAYSLWIRKTQTGNGGGTP